MKATKIMIIRHGEKPSNELFPRGVDVHGIKDSDSLIVKGWQRAGGVAVLFDPPGGIVLNDKLAKPQHLFAPKFGKHKHSKRSEQVLSVLADKIGVKVDTSIDKGDETKMAHHAMHCEGIVLIAWEHENIHLISNVITGDESTPQGWPSNRFDIVFVFDYDEETKSYKFSQTTQMIMPGDKPTII